MRKERASEENPFFIQTKMGVVTKKGDWFHINEEQISEFSPGLLEHISFSSLIKEAQAWVSSASSLSLILIYLLLFFINPWMATVITIIFHFFWYRYKSAFVINKLYNVFTITNSTPFLFVIALVCLSYFAMQQQFVAAGIGLLFFILMKPGLLRKAWDKFFSSRAGLTLNDRLLKMIVIKHALYTENSSPDEISQMEDRFAEIVSKIKQ